MNHELIHIMSHLHFWHLAICAIVSLASNMSTVLSYKAISVKNGSPFLKKGKGMELSAYLYSLLKKGKGMELSTYLYSLLGLGPRTRPGQGPAHERGPGQGPAREPEPAPEPVP